MKNDKFCVSKTLAYLVTLVVAVVGAFYVMNYVNGQKLVSNSKAAPSARYIGTSCPSYLDNTCHKLKQTDGTYKKTGAICSTVSGKRQWRVDTGSTCAQEICMYGNKNVYDTGSGITVATDGCLIDTVGNNGYRCKKGNISAYKDSVNCAKPVANAARGCYYGNYNVDSATVFKYRADGDECIVEYSDNTNTGTAVGLTGYKCATNATTGSRYSVKASSSTDACYKGAVARSSCTINGQPVADNPGYTMNGACIQLNGRNTGLKCDSSTNWKNVTNKTDCPPQATTTTRTQCTFGDKAVTDYTGYTIDTNGCIQLNGGKIGLKCNSGTSWKNVPDSTTCAASRAACDTSGASKCGTNAYGSCVNAGGGTYFKCECYGTNSAPRLNTTTPYDTASCS